MKVSKRTPVGCICFELVADRTIVVDGKQKLLKESKMDLNLNKKPFQCHI